MSGRSITVNDQWSSMLGLGFSLGLQSFHLDLDLGLGVSVNVRVVVRVGHTVAGLSQPHSITVILFSMPNARSINHSHSTLVNQSMDHDGQSLSIN